MEQRMADPSFYTTEADIAGFMRAYQDAKTRIAGLEAERDRLTE